MTLQNHHSLVTGAAGFIGNHLAHRLFQEGSSVLCLDNFSPSYDPELKRARQARLEKRAGGMDSGTGKCRFVNLDLRDQESVLALFEEFRPDSICHLAGQAGVRYSLKQPHAYVDNNISATVNLLEAARLHGVKDFVFASTSSVYGLNTEMPFVENAPIDTTISTYAATKRACELLCHAYHHTYGIRIRILRFFTVYGPWGRPDMALSLFTRAILNDESIDVYNHGRMRRDFTYVDDIVNGFVAALQIPLDFEIINLGSGEPVELIDFIQTLEKALECKAKKQMQPLQPGDVPVTWADISKARRLLGYEPKVRIEEGIPRFVEWYREYYNV